jgi:hypothetical protein
MPEALKCFGEKCQKLISYAEVLIPQYIYIFIYLLVASKEAVIEVNVRVW